MITMQDRRTKRTMEIGDHERVKKQVLIDAGWFEVTSATPTVISKLIEKKIIIAPTDTLENTPPPTPVFEGPESATTTALDIGGSFGVVEVEGTEGGEGPFIELEKEGGSENFFGVEIPSEGEEGGVPKIFAEEIEVVTEGDKEALAEVEEEPAAEVEVLPEAVEVKRKGRGRPVGTKKGPAHAWEGNLPE